MASVEELCDHITLINKSKTILEGSVSDVKQKFKMNLFELVCSGDYEKLIQQLNGSISIIHSQTLPDGNHILRVQLPEKSNGNTFLSLAMQHVSVISFQELLPTMNEIFIKAVSKN